jgi:hypothetical protein
MQVSRMISFSRPPIGGNTTLRGHFGQKTTLYSQEYTTLRLLLKLTQY